MVATGLIQGPIEFNYPEYFPKPAYNFQKNPLTQEKIDLGRALFYDPILSLNNTISCASCHSPYNAFAHTDHALSHGIHDSIGTRNAPALFNLAWHKSFMWDGAINHLDMQSLFPITHPDEMGEDLQNVVEKLQNKQIYPSLFFQAFGDSIVTGEHILKALSQFQLTLVSSGSKYDSIQRGLTVYSDQEARGYYLFRHNCSACHKEPLFTSGELAINGLEVDTTLNDFGRLGLTREVKDSLMFKMPSLRNLSYTFPYMHDGRFKKLRQVLNHYNGRRLNVRNDYNQSVDTITIQLSSNEKTDLIAFLLTLNDRDFVFDQKHQYPKKILLANEGF